MDYITATVLVILLIGDIAVRINIMILQRELRKLMKRRDEWNTMHRDQWY